MGSDWDIPNILSMQSPLRNPCEPAHETGRVCFGQSSVTDRGLSSLEVCHVTDDYVHRRKSTCIDAYAVIGHFFSFPSFVSHPQDGNLSVTDWWVLHAFIVFFSLGDPPIQKNTVLVWPWVFFRGVRSLGSGSRQPLLVARLFSPLPVPSSTPEDLLTWVEPGWV